jgi:methionyl-tRNA formyltransferase
VPHVVCAYGEVGHEALDELLSLGADVALVVTHRDAPGEKIWFASVAARAARAGIPVITPDDVNADDAVAAIAAVHPDFLFSFYYRQMMKRRVLALPSRGALNLHGSLLPRYRGRAPVNWAIVNGESETGVTLHEMDEKPDHGAIVAQRRVAIDRDDTALRLTRKLAAAGRELLRDVYPLLIAGRAPRIEQDHAGSSYFGGRTPADGRIDWTRPSDAIRNLVRAVTDPWPGAFTHLDGRKLLVWAAEPVAPPVASAPGTVLGEPADRLVVATGDGALELLDVSFEGGERTSGAAWARAAGIRAGCRFASPGVSERSTDRGSQERHT